MIDGVHLEIDDPRWRAVLDRLPHDFYHRPEYVALEGELHEAIPRAFWASAGDREFFIPYMVRRCDTLFPEGTSEAKAWDVVSPYGYPGIILSDAARESSEFIAHAIQELSESFRAGGVCSAFFRMNPMLSGNFAEIFPANFFAPSSDTIAMDLRLDDTAMWESIRHGHQWVITKCKKLGFVPRMVPFAENIDDFMTIYRETMDRVKARDSYYFQRDYFERLASFSEHVHCCFADFEGEPAAACVVFECGGIVQAHLGGTKTNFMKKSPFHLVLYHLAQWARERGNRHLHLGGGVGGSDDRLFEFKRGFSDQIFPFYTVRMITDQDRYAALTKLRTETASATGVEFVDSDYFPAYRTP